MIDKNVYCGIVGRAVNNWYCHNVPIKETLEDGKSNWGDFILTLSTPYGYKFKDTDLRSPIVSYLLVNRGAALLKKTKNDDSGEYSSFLSSVLVLDDVVLDVKKLSCAIGFELDISKYVHLCHLIIMGMTHAYRKDMGGNTFKSS